MIDAIAEPRLRRQLLTTAARRSPEDVVAWFGAVQAQEYEPAKWALALRMQDGASAQDVERAIDEGRVLRTHVMRPTWHFVAAADIRWLLELTAPRVQRRMAPYDAHLGLDAKTLVRALRVIERALRDRGVLIRAELGDRLRRAGLPMTSMHLAHVVMHAELERVVCSGPRRGKQFTYALLEERVPNVPRLPADEALATAARRFFRSHGPATIRDFVWWSGLSTADAKRAVAIIGARGEEVDGQMYWTCDREPRGTTRDRLAHLLPIYDEYLVAYRDRAAVPHGHSTKTGLKRWTTFAHAVVIAGQVAGSWRPVRRTDGIVLEMAPLRRLTRSEREAVAEAARRYEQFVAAPLTLAIR
jgi:hypothetical protein